MIPRGVRGAARAAAAAAVAACLAAGAGPALAQGCAMCGTAVGEAADPLARSISASVLFMVSMPFVLFVSVAGWLVARHRSARKEESSR
ncbi:MAG TPA: hypothetical protein VJV23_16290 [Candidatus Polarisedimenticolia bacterium]|nr:hypothetical protein [Candidatus Polarisedimenticolia bacterium]